MRSQWVTNLYAPQPKPASRRLASEASVSGILSPFPPQREDLGTGGPGPKNGSEDYPESPKRLLNGCKRPCGLSAHSPRLRPRRKTRSGRISPERLLGERTHQELQQGLVEGAGRFLRPIALVRGLPRAARVQTPQGDRGRRRACPSQRWREPGAHSTQHGLAAATELLHVLGHPGSSNRHRWIHPHRPGPAPRCSGNAVPDRWRRALWFRGRDSFFPRHRLVVDRLPRLLELFLCVCKLERKPMLKWGWLEFSPEPVTELPRSKWPDLKVTQWLLDLRGYHQNEVSSTLSYWVC